MYKNEMISLYFLLDKNKVVYIGMSQSCESRIKEHRKTKVFDSVRIVPVDTRRHVVADYERRWIIKFRPKYNTVNLFAWFGPERDKLQRINVQSQFERRF